jgi:HAMP domain-containing protein
LIVRRLIVVVAALLLAAQVVRNAAVEALATLRPQTAAKFWAGHPSVEISLGLAQIGRAARARKSVDPRTFAMIDDAAVKSPLSPEPFLVRGVQAQMAGDAEAAKGAFLAAQSRDPRSLPAAYFLADYYFRAGQALPGLEQTVLLARLSPGGTGAVAPFVAAYAQNPSNWAQMRALFRSQPTVEDDVLAVLAQDSRNVDAVLAVADPAHRTPASRWLPVLLQSLVSSGDYQQARAIWGSIGRGRPGDQLLYDATFSSPQPPPPFNWSLASSTLGLAERQPGKRLHLIFYGNEDGVLASELVLLPAGTYQLQMQVVGAPVHPESLRWSIRCDKSQEPVASVGLDQVARRGWTFEIPANCPAQWLELSGRSGDIAQQSDVTITGLSLTRTGTNA